MYTKSNISGESEGPVYNRVEQAVMQPSRENWHAEIFASADFYQSIWKLANKELLSIAGLFW